MARLTFDTFPRSGTIWLETTLSLCFPDNEIKWGQHRSSTFITAENCITSVRNPRQAVSSYLSFFGESNVEGALRWYCRFMQRTMDYRDRIYVAKFDDLITDPMREIQQYANKFNLAKPKSITYDQIYNVVRVNHADHLPKKISQQKLKTQILVNNCIHLSKALKIYEKVII